MSDSKSMLVGVLALAPLDSGGSGEDPAGTFVVDTCKAAGHDVVAYHVCPPDEECLAASLVEMCDVDEVDLLLTVGGTGLGGQDLLPDVTANMVARLVPGFSEGLRAYLSDDCRVCLDRGVAGLRGSTFIVNLPGEEGLLDRALRWTLDRASQVAGALGGRHR